MGVMGEANPFDSKVGVPIMVNGRFPIISAKLEPFCQSPAQQGLLLPGNISTEILMLFDFENRRPKSTFNPQTPYHHLLTLPRLFTGPAC